VRAPFYSETSVLIHTHFRLDGLNKDLDPWDSSFYMGEFRNLCAKEKMNELKWPARDYIVQVARFDPAKGIPNVIDSYARFRRLLRSSQSDFSEEEHPQLLICGHGAVDDPDVLSMFYFTTSHADTAYNRRASSMIKSSS
jgi:hypothetical protein